MDIVLIFVVTANVISFCLALLIFRVKANATFQHNLLWVSKNLVYKQVISRRQFIGPWSWLQVTVHLAAIALNAVGIVVEVHSLEQANLRAAYLALGRVAPLTLSGNLSLLTDMLCLPLTAIHQLHYSFAFISIIDITCHVFMVLIAKSFSLNLQQWMCDRFLSLGPYFLAHMYFVYMTALFIVQRHYVDL